MAEQNDYEYPALVEMYQLRGVGKDMREMVARTHSVIFARVQSQLDALRDRMLELEDPTSAEFKQVHMRARVLGTLFGEIKAVIEDAKAAEVSLAEHEASKNDNDQGEEQ